MVLAWVPADWSPTAWAATGTWATFVIYVVIGLYARKQVEEARTLREEQARPWVVVDFEPGFIFHLTVENIGRTVARDVSIRFDPPLMTTLSKPWAWEESTLLTDGIPLLPPGRKLSIFFDSFGARMESDLPKVYDVFLEYDGPADHKRRLTSYYRLDFRFHWGMEMAPKGMPDLVKTLGEVRDEMKKWTDGSSGITAKIVDRAKETRRQDGATIRRYANDVRKREGWWAAGKILVKQPLRRRGRRFS